MIAVAFLRALAQIGLPGVRAVLWRTLVLTLLVLALLGAAIWFALHWLLMRLGWSQADGVGGALLSTLVIAVGVWLLFRVIAMAIVGFQADRIVIAVEQASYPERLAAARPVPFAVELRMTTRSTLRALGWNIAALPAYLLLLPTGIGPPLLFLALNAYLLGRDLAELVEARHPAVPRFTAAARWQLGLASALLSLPPVVNLLAPVLGVAMATHMFHGRMTRRA